MTTRLLEGKCEAARLLEEVHGERRNLLVQLSTTARELRVSQATVSQLEAVLAETQHLWDGPTQPTVIATPTPGAVNSQVLVVSISHMTLGADHLPTAPTLMVRVTPLPMETTSVQATATMAVPQACDWRTLHHTTRAQRMPLS